jgi:hypothetical protein
VKKCEKITKIGDWGLGIGDWGLGPIPNPQSPIPNLTTHLNIKLLKANLYFILNKAINNFTKYYNFN